jgi:PAS domain-containing protein
MARDQVEEFSFKSDLLLLGSIVTSIMLAGLALILLHRMINSMKERSSAQLSAALEGMPQGLGMFDGEQRLIVCNANYAAMYGLRPELTEPGTSLRAILQHRVETGTSRSMCKISSGKRSPRQPIRRLALPSRRCTTGASSP